MKIHALRPVPLMVSLVVAGLSFCLSAAQTPKVGEKAPMIEGKDQADIEEKANRLADVITANLG